MAAAGRALETLLVVHVALGEDLEHKDSIRVCVDITSGSSSSCRFKIQIDKALPLPTKEVPYTPK